MRQPDLAITLTIPLVLNRSISNCATHLTSTSQTHPSSLLAFLTFLACVSARASGAPLLKVCLY